MESFEACTSLADSTTGNLLFYANGERIWDRTHQLMPAGYPLGGSSSASEGAVALFAPGQPGRAYVFTTDAKENNLRNSLRYSVVDLRLRGGLGDVVRRSVPVTLPGGALATEHLAAVRQPNGRDYWLVVHGARDNAFYAYALTPSGLAAQPVVSFAGAVFDNTDASYTGTLRFSPSGQQLAMTQLIAARLDLFDFNPLTGRVGPATTLFDKPDARYIPSVYRVFGCEFLPMAASYMAMRTGPWCATIYWPAAPMLFAAPGGCLLRLPRGWASRGRFGAAPTTASTLPAWARRPWPS